MAAIDKIVADPPKMNLNGPTKKVKKNGKRKIVKKENQEHFFCPDFGHFVS